MEPLPGAARPRRRGLAALVISAGLAISTVACGLSTQKSDVESGVGCRVPGVATGQVNIGMIYPNSGSAADLFAPYRAGVDARLGVENAAGGVYGRKISYSWADDESDLNSNLAAARTLVNSGNVFGLIEATTDATGSAAWLHDRDVPVVGTALEAVWSQYDNMFSYANFIKRGQSVTTWGDFVKARGGTRVAVLYSPLNDTSRIFRDKFVQSMQAAGLSVGVPIPANPTSVDYAAVVAEIKAQHADALVGGMDPQTFITAAVRAQLAGAHLKTIVTTDGYDQRVIDQAGRYLAGTLAVSLGSSPFEENLPADREFLRAMAEYAPQIQPQKTEIGLEGWIAADLLIRGLNAAGPCPTRAGFVRALRAVKDYNAGGLLPKPVDLAEVFGKQNRCFTFVQITQSGTGWQVMPPAPRCGTVLGGSS